MGIIKFLFYPLFPIDQNVGLKEHLKMSVLAGFAVGSIVALILFVVSIIIGDVS